MGIDMESTTTAADSVPEPTRKATPAPRLFIQEMVMKNFKSYAGEQRVGPFHKNFSAVVGPNGSGKSNVIDAMLFVFGKRAKQMRLNKVSELIHNSTNHQNLESAGVSVHFQEIIDLDDGNYEVVSGSDFIITRVAFRDNSSKYYINDRASNFTEVTKFLRGKGVDLDNNRFLILQGEVEQISLMKPKAQGPHDEGFLEYLEDIIGTNKYVENIDESFKELEALNEKRTSVVQMVKLAEKETESLEGVKNEAEEYMLKELSLLKWQEKATKLASENNITEIADIQAAISSLEANVKSERNKIQENTRTLKELEALHVKYMKRHEELDNDLRRSRNDIKEFERQNLKDREDYDHLKKKIKKLNDKLERDVTKIADYTKECEDSVIEIPKLEEQICQLQKQLVNEEKILEEIEETSKAETEVFRSELADVRTELEPWEKQMIDCRGKLEVASAEKDLLNRKHEAGCAAYEDAKKKIVEINATIETKTSAVKDIENELVKKKSEASEARRVEQALLEEQHKLVPLEQAARQRVAELSSTMESERNQSSVLKAIIHAKEANIIPGIYGRMGDLGAIDAKYDIAISTACAGLDYIVVEKTSAAQACVELLRSQNLGVATFMILEKQTNHLPRLREKVVTPEGVPRLFDLIKVQDERMKLAFFAALGNTIVAKDIDQATRIAYGGKNGSWRVVTLDGALFEKSGTMTGGGNRPSGGKMGTSIRASVSGEAVATAEKELSDLAERLNNIRNRISDAIRSYRDSENAISPLEMNLTKTRKEIESLKLLLGDLEKQLSSLKAGSQASKAELAKLQELEHIISDEEKEMNRLLKGSEQLINKALELQNKIENAGGERLKNQKAKVSKIQSDIDKNSTKINRGKVQIETGQKTIEKLTKGIEESKVEKERLLGEKEKLRTASKETEEKAIKVMEDSVKIQGVINEHKEVLDQAKSDYENLKKVMDTLRTSQVDAEYKLQDKRKACKELEIKGKAYKKRLDDLEISISKHLDQIQKDLVDPVKLEIVLTDATLAQTSDLKQGLEKVALLEAQLKDMNPNLDSISEYRKKVSLYNERVADLNLVTQQRDDIKKQYDEWRKKRLDEFMAGFNTISLKLKEMYQMITLGGDAELELVDSLDPFSEGVVFSVRPPKKSWKNIANLSGGEKTLSSLALVFALHHYKPTPLYVMDEIDAALDFKNVSIVGHYVKDRTKDAQFIIISLRNNMFELADRLVGIYKTDNCTKSITINPESFVVCKQQAS
ncbi:structural maintenance of chromosomes protein 4-like [Salvia splendens]|uniref:structural maintenance of chromosomes protein 4-like n=1 Tax=Salvia splendens TaxID=180675 RepID=UPI001C265F81|nr:structural maintenance of chromosomes protein 4-like [Salvia splendens]